MDAIADYNDAIAETDYNDNASTAVQVDVTPSQANLGISSVSGSSPSVPVGGNDTFSYTVKNMGTATATASTLGIYLSSDSTISTADTLITTVARPSLTAGATNSGSFTGSLPSSEHSRLARSPTTITRLPKAMKPTTHRSGCRSRSRRLPRPIW